MTGDDRKFDLIKGRDLPHTFEGDIDESGYCQYSSMREANRCWVRSRLPTFNGTIITEEFFHWSDTIEGFFEEMQPPENLKCKLVSYTLEGEIDEWWQQLQKNRVVNGKEKISSWPRMERLLFNYCIAAKYSTKILLQSVDANCQATKGTEMEKHNKGDRFSHNNCLMKCPLEAQNSNQGENGIHELSGFLYHAATSSDIKGVTTANKSVKCVEEKKEEKNTEDGNKDDEYSEGKDGYNGEIYCSEAQELLSASMRIPSKRPPLVIVDKQNKGHTDEISLGGSDGSSTEQTQS